MVGGSVTRVVAAVGVLLLAAVATAHVAPDSVGSLGACAPVPLSGVGGGEAGSGPCTGQIRPGAYLVTPFTQCTINWIVAGDDGRHYAGTAGHCVEEGDRVSTPGVGDWGTVAATEDAGTGADWAWIRVDPGKVRFVNPRLCHWGGPARDEPMLPAGPAYAYGWGVGVGSLPEARPRTHVAIAPGEESPVRYGNNVWSDRVLTRVGFASGGDSGSPVLSVDGAPYGMITHSGTPLAGGLLKGTQFRYALVAGEEALGVDLTLVHGGPVDGPAATSLLLHT